MEREDFRKGKKGTDRKRKGKGTEIYEKQPKVIKNRQKGVKNQQNINQIVYLFNHWNL